MSSPSLQPAAVLAETCRRRGVAFIFDLDDTLAATSPLWRRAESVLLERMGRSWTPELAALYKGMNVDDVAVTIHRRIRPALSVTSCQAGLRATLFEAFSEGPLRAMPGAVECVGRLKALGPLALASGSPLPLIEMALSKLGVRDAFSVLVSSEEVRRGKPHPDVFLEAARRLDVSPSNVLVLEDSLAGAHAAQSAGMHCFVVPSIDSPDLKACGARILASLDEVTVEAVHGAFA